MSGKKNRIINFLPSEVKVKEADGFFCLNLSFLLKLYKKSGGILSFDFSKKTEVFLFEVTRPLKTF